ncbi:MAG TPA: protein-L-isoaspartate(D-aspartate) O-methyltransferase [Alphaproteobacteria bacterium]|nr:protein-L-isoaspartate(D-aspartate) O-methyltransferase [Alphaproteobacteria bacterium]
MPLSLRAATTRAFALLGSIAFAGTAAAQTDPYAAERAHMVDTVRAHAADPRAGAPGGRISERVLGALGKVPRHVLVPKRLRPLAYADRPLPIGYGQTISQPYIVALMTELLATRPSDRVLEVGTGSGYQAAVLAHLVSHVYSIEIVKPLAERAARDLKNLGLTNVTVKAGDGYKGWPSNAPFDGIIVTAAPTTVPPPLIDQLKPGGRLVLPLEERNGRQFLMVLEKGPDGKVARRRVIEVRFVPLTRTPR